MSILFVRISGLLARGHGASDEAALVSERNLVRDLNPTASKAGLCLGASTREARALVPGLQVYEYNPDLYETLRNEWLDLGRAVTDEIESIAPDQAFFDLSRHSDPADIAQIFIDQVERRLGCDLSSGLSPTKWVAKTLAGPKLRVIPLPGLALAKEPVSVLTPIDPKIRERLAYLGYKKIQAVQTLSLGILKQQFSHEAMRIHLAANGALGEPIYSNYPLPSLVATQNLPGGCDNLEMLRWTIHKMCSKLVFRLNSAQLEANRMRIVLALEEKQCDHQATFAKPIRTTSALTTALLRAIDSLKIQEPIYGMTIHLRDLSRAISHQSALTGLGKAENQDAENILEPLREKFGSYSVHLGKDHIVPRRIEVLRTWSKATGWQ